MPAPAAILVTLVICAGVGYLHGAMVNRLNVPPFVITLVTFTILSATYIHYGSTEPSNTFFPNLGTPGQTIYERHVDGLSSNAVATLSPSMVLTVRFGQNRFPDYDPNFSNGFKLTQLGFPAAVDALTPAYPAFPSITTGEFTAYGGGNTAWTVFHSQSLDVELAKFVGKHSIKVGFDYRLIADAYQTSTGPGSYGFTSAFTSQTAAKNVTGTGGGLASMLLGNPASGSITQGSFFNFFTHYTAFYIQDDYRMTSKLTLNFGFRGEHEPAPQETNNKELVDANLSLPNPLQASIPGLTLLGQAEYAGLNGNPVYAGNALAIKMGPRIGFAYSMNPKTVFRGGFGIFWIPQSFSGGSFNSSGQTTGYSQTTSIVSSINGGYTPYASLNNPYPNGLTPIAGNSLGDLGGDRTGHYRHGERQPLGRLRGADVARRTAPDHQERRGLGRLHRFAHAGSAVHGGAESAQSQLLLAGLRGPEPEAGESVLRLGTQYGVAGQRPHNHPVDAANAVSGILVGQPADQYGPRHLLLVLRQGAVAGEVWAGAERDVHVVAHHGAEQSAGLHGQYRGAGLDTGGHRYSQQLLDVGVLPVAVWQGEGVHGERQQGHGSSVRRLVD